MFVPVLKRIKEQEKCFIERLFPVDGNVQIKEGDYVEPFNHLGDCRFCQNEIILPSNFKPENLKGDNKFYYSGSLLGKSKKEKIFAPYDGNLILKEDKSYIYKENDRKYVLLSGVWGNVKSIHEKKSVLIETQTKDILFSASTGVYTSGELVVFPNPSDILKQSYLENFVKGIKGKIIYIGHFVGLDVVKKAYEMEASAVVAGSAHSEVFDFARTNNFAFGIFSGFGKIKTPENVYRFLSSVSYRYVFFDGDRNILKIPVREEDLSEESKSKKDSKKNEPEEYVKEIDKGMKVHVLQNPYFGWIGTVDRVSESSIFVKFGFEDNAVEIKYPNYLILE